MVRGFGWDGLGSFEHRDRNSTRRWIWSEPNDRVDQQGWILRWRTGKEPASQTVERSEPKYMTKSGVRVRSKAEKIIADYFTDHRIWFIYEMPLRIGGLCLRPDFYLPDYDMVHEHFGLDEEGYRRAAEAKISQYQRHGIGFSYTTAADEADIEQVLTMKLRKYGVRV